jgi:acyl-CoA synthetase (AMP-forming)/AMP-acid ligase II
VNLDFLFGLFEEKNGEEAIVWRDRVYRYGELLARVDECRRAIRSPESGIWAGRVTALEADFSPTAISLLLALAEADCVLVPLAAVSQDRKHECLEVAQAEVLFSLDAEDRPRIAKQDRPPAAHAHFRELGRRGHPGLVLFSSGSTGKSKAAVHDLSALLEKFKTRRHCLRTLSFLLFDHIGGFDTLFYSLSNASCIVTVPERSPDTVCGAIEKFRVEVLPVTPTFLNLLLLSGAHLRHDLSSLKYITYGTEVMPEATLKKLSEVFPGITILQKYGMTEVGTLRSKSESSDSLWVKVGGEGYETRVVNGILQIKARSAMLGYLNAPSPFSEDGWLDTGDAVQIKGEYLRILGRASEIINVGGQKVWPAEVESVICALVNVSEVTVYGEKNPVTGNIVCAKISLAEEEDRASFLRRLRAHCQSKLEPFKIPVKISFSTGEQHAARFKKIRKTPDSEKAGR